LSGPLHVVWQEAVLSWRQHVVPDWDAQSRESTHVMKTPAVKVHWLALEQRAPPPMTLGSTQQASPDAQWSAVHGLVMPPLLLSPPDEAPSFASEPLLLPLPLPLEEPEPELEPLDPDDPPDPEPEVDASPPLPEPESLPEPGPAWPPSRSLQPESTEHAVAPKTKATQRKSDLDDTL
jgi:hypothetical protein